VGLVLAVLASFEPMMILVRSSTRLAASMAAAERLQSLAETTSTIASPAGALPPPEVFDICFDHVTFSHDGRAIVLDDVTFEIAQGECVALRGASGAGKSTIAHLLLRLVDPVTGAIRIGGRDIRALDLGGLRKVLALMTQDAPLFSDTIRNNLTIGRADASEAELWDMLAKVNLDDTVRQLPSGLDTIVGEAGRTLSAGQARRVALARTLLSPAPIIVLDEPTDGLDREAEDAFLRSLPRIALGRTLVVITHAEVPSAFRVLELRAGRMTEASDGLQVMPYQSLS
jgi:ATP-binding cassette subfamily C protein CydC